MTLPFNPADLSMEELLKRASGERDVKQLVELVAEISRRYKQESRQAEPRKAQLEPDPDTKDLT